MKVTVRVKAVLFTFILFVYKNQNSRYFGPGGNLVVECLPSILKAMTLIPSINERNFLKSTLNLWSPLCCAKIFLETDTFECDKKVLFSKYAVVSRYAVFGFIGYECSEIFFCSLYLLLCLIWSFFQWSMILTEIKSSDLLNFIQSWRKKALEKVVFINLFLNEFISL